MPIDLSSVTQHLPAGLTEKLPTATLSKFWDNYKPQLIGGLAGAGIGAAGLGGAAALSGEEDPAVKSQNVKRNLLLGATLGGLGGAGIGAGYQMYNEPSHEGALSRLFRFTTGSRAVQGASAANLLNAAARRTVNSGAPKWMGGSGGNFQGKSFDQMREALDAKVKGVMEGIQGASPVTGMGTPAPAGAAASRLSTSEQGVREMVERMSGGNGLLARLSQNPAVRGFGLNVVDGRAEQHMLNSLRPLTDSSEGRAVLQRILSDQGIKGRGMPLLEKALLGGASGEEALRRVNTFSRLGRLGTGAAAMTGLAQLFGD